MPQSTEYKAAWAQLLIVLEPMIVRLQEDEPAYGSCRVDAEVAQEWLGVVLNGNPPAAFWELVREKVTTSYWEAIDSALKHNDMSTALIKAEQLLKFLRHYASLLGLLGPYVEVTEPKGNGTH